MSGTVGVPLHRIAHGRAGDKGDRLNVSVIAYRPEHYELIREQVLRRTREELPHAVEVEVAAIERREDGLIEVRADVWAETDSQKAILIGKGGRMVRDIGAAARREIERDLGARVYLDLKVRVRPRWRRDESLLDRLGID